MTKSLDLTPATPTYTVPHAENLNEWIVCVIKYRSHYCGYVGVPFHSKLFGLSYIGFIEDIIDVHGGLTYSTPDDIPTRLDGTNYPIKVPETWWFGFDCNHSSDISKHGGTPKTIEFAIAECHYLLNQLQELDTILSGIKLSKH